MNKALEQLLNDSAWGDLDYLIVDMPPGTGDIHLTMAQKMPITATIVVTTPQDIALIDVGKSINMFNKLGIPCLGVVENMSSHTCINCGHKSAIFGTGASDKLKSEFNLELLANLPLDISICQASDQGIPLSSQAKTPLADIYTSLAQNVMQQLALLPKDHSHKLGNINIIQN